MQLFNFQKGDNIISKLINKFRGKKTGENQIDENITYPEVQSVPSSYMNPVPAQEDVQAPYQYYYLPYQPTPVLPSDETIVAPPLPQQTFYPNSQFWPSVNIEKDVNINKDVDINKFQSLLSHPYAIPPQLPTSIHGKDHGSPIYSTSIVINNEPKQVVKPQPAPLPNDATMRRCNGNCHLHITHGHDDITPYPNNGNSQSYPPHPPSVYQVQPSPVYTNPPTLPYPALAPPAIPPTVSHDSHFDVNIHRVPENKQTDQYLPVYASSQPPKYPLPIPPATPPIYYSHDSHFNANIPIVPENRETNQNPISPNHQPIYIQNDPRLRPHFVQHQNPPQIQHGQDYSSHSSMHHQLIYETSRPSNPTHKYPQTRYENDKPIPSELGLPNKQGQPTIIEREKTSTVIVETQPRSDIPDTSIEYRSAELPPRIEGGYRLVPVRSRIVEHPPLHRDGGEFREKDEFSRSGTYATHQERQVVPQVSYVDSSLLASTNHFEELKAKSSSMPDNRFRS